MSLSPIAYLRSLWAERPDPVDAAMERAKRLADRPTPACPVEEAPADGYGGGAGDDEAMTDPVPLEPSHKPDWPWPPAPPRSAMHGSGPALPGWSRESRLGCPDYRQQDDQLRDADDLGADRG